MSSLPIPNLSKREADISLFFDRYYTQPINFSDSELNAVNSFFLSKGFNETASIAISGTLLNQAKNDDVKIFTLLDTLGSYEPLQLSAIVAEILNYNRKRTSVVGFKKDKDFSKFESRNIIG